MVEEANYEDRISELPDGVLSLILSRLTMKDLVQTRLLSKRWLNLWELRRSLNFDILNMCNLDLDLPPDVLESDDGEHEYLDEITEEFVQLVDEFMRTFPAPKIDSLRLTLYAHGYQYDSIIHDWISCAVAKGVEEIDMLSYLPFSLNRPRHMYRFPFDRLPAPNNEHNVTTLKHLCLHRCILIPPPPPHCVVFHYLKTLRLYGASVHEGFTTWLLSNALVLEVLCLSKCSLQGNLEISGPFLRHLEVLDCSHGGDVRISAPKLTVFEYKNNVSFLRNIHPKRVFSVDAPQLTKILFYTPEEVAIPCVLSQFAASSRLEHLYLHLLSEPMQSMPRNLTLLANLKQLELTCTQENALECSDLMWLSAFLKASPLLQKLTWRRRRAPHGYSENKSERWEPEDFTHSQLKEVEIAACAGNWYEIEFAVYMLQSVQSLEQIVFNPSRRYYVGAGDWFEEEGSIDHDRHRYWLESGREIVRQKLQDKFPAGATIVLL